MGCGTVGGKRTRGERLEHVTSFSVTVNGVGNSGEGTDEGKRNEISFHRSGKKQ